ncbi:hypothetical protein [Natronomonas sp. EA1]|uniref:hypothetical protein n=1 Tax=Natronomonas sp. EA1 TaxID=3421655 RepID=UPI003EBD1278
MKRNELLEALTADILGYVMAGKVSEGVVAEAISPQGLDERFEEFEFLVDLHFLLREDVVQFVRDLPRHLRELETSTRTRTHVVRGGVRGRVNWQRTLIRRYGESPSDTAMFVCDTRTENYDTDENLVLKHLLSVVHRTLDRAERFLDREYDWVHDAWLAEDLVDDLRRVFERNVHVRRIRDPEQYEPTDRMLATAEASRQGVYREAARLVRAREAARTGKRDAIRDLLERTAITPDDEETLFELFVLFRIISTIEDLRDGEFTLRTIESGKQEIARFDGEKEVVIYHDSSASDRSLSFLTSPKEAEKSDEALTRAETVQRTARSVAKDYFGSGFDERTGRPDVVVLEIHDEGTNEYDYFITEVKHSTRRKTVLQGIRETLEYLAFLRVDEEFAHGDGDDGPFFGDGWNGLLVTQDMDSETRPLEEQETIRILQASELEAELATVLDRVV